jgi:hypothetical protein
LSPGWIGRNRSYGMGAFSMHVAEHEATPLHVLRTLPSALMVIDLMPVGSLAETEMVILPMYTRPFVGELIDTLGDAGAGED